MQHGVRAGATALAVMLAAALAGCSGGSGADVEELPGSGGGTGSATYNGPPPATPDVQAFKISLFDNVRAPNRCGACHSLDGGQSPLFARSDDVNLAYAEANPLVNLTSPGDSPMVLKVLGGHNCWLTSDEACADILETWITNWAGELATGGREIELEPPPLRDPGESKSFPADVTLFETHVYPVLRAHCATCHSASSTTRQSPFFAEGPEGDPLAVQAAYDAAKARIDLDDPAASRFVVRLREESHNCWTADCGADADVMEDAIRAFANNVPLTSVDPALLTSKALTLYEGTIAAGGNRYEANQIALWEFKTGQGGTAFDTSGVEPAMDLTLSGAVEWFGGWGLAFSGGKAQASTTASRKLYEQILATGEYSVEAWVAPGNVVQEDARIVSYSAGEMQRNFNLGQNMYDYEFFVRTETSDENGNPQLSTPSADEVLQATLQHVVATFDPVEGRKIYVNGELVADQDPAPGGLLTSWDDTFAFVLGNEVSGMKPWTGVIRLVAIHNRVLTPEQIVQNFEAGVGEKFFLLFGVEHLTNVPQSYVVFEAAQFDSYAYLFRKPFFISLDGSVEPGSVPIRGIRIGLNGAESPVGQAYGKLSTTITSADYDPATGQLLSTLGTVVPLEKGPESDEFFLTFDAIGGLTYNRPPLPTPAPPAPVDLPEMADIGVRTFDEINATMAAITGVDPNHPDVRATFDTVRQSLPAIPTLEAVLASHQVAIAQLAIEYCNALIENPTLRAQKFPGFPFDQPPAAAFASRDALVDPLLDRMLGVVHLATQPDRAFVEAELGRLLDGIPGDTSRPGLINTPGVTNDASRTRTLAKAVCSAVLGSAAMLIQ
ncbi:MAG TPA: LamG domain-containing protein [Gammaproteobacteria bacterium]